jgi:hypothetical protein
MALEIAIGLQPKQWRLRDLITEGPAVCVGAGGGRGAAKSGAADRIVVSLLMEEPGVLACIVMRNYDQVFKYHIEPIKRTFPQLERYLSTSNKNLILPTGADADGNEICSQLDFSYGENLVEIERRFRSASYKYIIIDQAEQFTVQELREIRKACRWPGGGKAVAVLLFNMGGASIQDLRKWFDLHEYNEREDPADYAFVHFYPWDNVEWVRSALLEDGLSPKDYYRWTDPERKAYAAERGPYTKGLASDDDAIRNRDWESSWDSFEGAFFGRVYDKASTMVDRDTIAAIQKPWDKLWMSQDWGKAHYCCTQWHSMSTLSPTDALAILGWVVTTPLKVIVTYRRLIVSELTSTQVGQAIVKATPEDERRRIKNFYLSPDAFGERDSANTIADNQGKETRAAHMPFPEAADTDRPGGWSLMHSMLWNTKSHGATGDTVWLISSDCPEVLDSIPLLMRDPKDLDVVLKTDKGQAKLEQDVAETSRYGLKSMLGNVPKPFAVVMAEAVQEATLKFGPTAGSMVRLRMEGERKKKTRWTRGG